MSDQCRFCVGHEAPKVCRSLECSIKESWYVKDLQSQLDAANARVEELGQEIALLKEHREIDKALIRGDYKKVDWKGRIIKDLEAELRWLKSIYPNHPEYEPPADELTRLGQEMGEYDG